MRRITVLSHLYDTIRRDPNFEHLRYISRFVPGVGRLNPQVLFIGAAPTNEDNRRTLPFSGFSGQLLDEQLANVDVERADTFATNVLKYRTPNGRPPRVDEFVWSKRYLRLEMQIIKAKTVVAFGQYATFAVLPKVDLEKAHGQVFEVGDMKFIPMWGLHDEQRHDELKQDFLNLNSLLHSRRN